MKRVFVRAVFSCASRRARALELSSGALGFRDEGEVEHEFLHHLVAASVHGIGATGDEHGRALPGLFAPEPEARSPDPSASRLVARGAGFSLHADVLVCPYRGEKRKLTALLTDGKVVRRILEHLGLPTTVPTLAPARSPPELEFAEHPPLPPARRAGVIREREPAPARVRGAPLRDPAGRFTGRLRASERTFARKLRSGSALHWLAGFMAAPEDALQHLLLDPDYWRPRLERLAGEPHQLVRFPRSDLSRSGIEVTELWLKAHDGLRLRALMARSAYHRTGNEVQVRTCIDLETCAIDWGAVERGLCDIVFPFPDEHRLEDRVLDVIRVVQAACKIEGIDGTRVSLYRGCQSPIDEFLVADLVRSRGWAS